MSDFSGDQELLKEFLTEAGELLADVDNKLVELERRQDDPALLNHIFRGFHTIKGGAGFLCVQPLVELCHLTENLFDLLRNGSRTLDPSLMDVIMSATATVRDMFDALGTSGHAAAADPELLDELARAISGEPLVRSGAPAVEPAVVAEVRAPAAQPGMDIDWQSLYDALTGVPSGVLTAVLTAVPPGAQPAAISEPAARAVPVASSPAGRRDTDQPSGRAERAGRRDTDKLVVKDNTIRIDTARLDQVLNLSGEIGLTKNRLTCLRTEIMQGRTSSEVFRALDEAVSQLDLLVSDLQNAVMKTRMQPVGRLFQKYPRMARDLARQLGKDLDLELAGEETELDKTMVEELNDPLVHLVRNAADHGIESPEDRRMAGKPEKGTVRLSARQAGDHIVIEISDDGRGMRPDLLRRKAVEKGLLDAESAGSLDDRQALHLIFMPGFSTKDTVSSVSGRGVGMDVVKSNIQKLNGRIEITSEPGIGSRISISLPLTLAILPVLVVRVGEQPFAVPLSMVREIIPIRANEVQSVSGRATMVVRDEVLPVRTLSGLIGWPQPAQPRYGVLLQAALSSLVLAVDSFIGRDDVVIKPLDQIKPRGVAGATLAGDGSVVLVLDMEALLADTGHDDPATLFAHAA
jgi:two-component system chemotaxis sensor kinase CheA